jgi:hypothetical protein
MENPAIEKIKDKVRQGRDVVDRILAAIPGYKSYVESAEAYDSDKVVREYLADRIIRLKSEITSFSAGLVRKGEHGIVKEIESVTIFMERILKKCQYADYSSSIFAKMKVSEAEKSKLVEYDSMLLTLLDETSSLVSSLDQTETTGIEQVLNSIKNKLKIFEKAYEDRKFKIMEGI